MNKKLHNQNAFTLIEILLYISLIGTMLVSITVLLSIVLSARIKNQTIIEVEAQGAQVMHIISQTIRNAENITLPTTGTSAASLTLDVIIVGDDPTIFDLSGGAIRIKEGAASPINLTNSKITASSLNFQNLSRTDTSGVVRVSFTLTHQNNQGTKEYDFEKIFYESASLRQ